MTFMHTTEDPIAVIGTFEGFIDMAFLGRVSAPIYVILPCPWLCTEGTETWLIKAGVGLTLFKYLTLEVNTIS